MFVDHLNTALTGLIELGIMDHFFTMKASQKYADKNPRQEKADDSSQRLGFITMASPVIFLAAMYVICSVILVWEIMGARAMVKKRRRETERNARNNSNKWTVIT